MSAKWTKEYAAPIQAIWRNGGREDGQVTVELCSNHVSLYAIGSISGDCDAYLDADTAEAVGRELIRMAQALRTQS